MNINAKINKSFLFIVSVPSLWRLAPPNLLNVPINIIAKYFRYGKLRYKSNILDT